MDDRTISEVDTRERVVYNLPLYQCCKFSVSKLKGDLVEDDTGLIEGRGDDIDFSVCMCTSEPTSIGTHPHRFPHLPTTYRYSQ
jgi:hypothetical protein